MWSAVVLMLPVLGISNTSSATRRSLLPVAFAKHQHVLVCLRQLPAAFKLLRHAHGCGAYRRRQNRLVVKPRTGLLKAVDGFAHEVPIEPAPIAEVAHDKARKRVRFHAAIVADVSLGQFCIMLAPGNYGTGPIAWPVIAGKNISVFGDGENCNITTTITYTSIGGVDEESVVFLNVDINDIDIDLAAAFAAVKVAQVYFVNCGVNVNRVDASPPGGPQVVRLFTCLITGLESSSVILVTGSQYLGGPITINATGFVLVEASSLAGCPAFVVDGTIACSSTLLATAVITGTGNLLLDATAQYPTLAAASITGPTVGNMDTAPFIGYTPAVPANWTVVPVQVAEALDELAAREPTVFAFQEGGTQEKNVYDNWADLYAALLVAGNSPKRIMIDDSVTSPCVIPAGAYDLSNAELMGKQFQTFLEFANGATLTGCFQKVSNGLRIDSQSAAEIFVLTAGAHTIVLDNQSVLSANVAPMFNVDAGAVFQIMMNNESTLVNLS